MPADPQKIVNLAQQPAQRGARLIALRHLRCAERKFAQAFEGDAKALHDFRVALRRLRTVFRVYRRWVDESISPKTERRLRRVARASNATRDFEVYDALVLRFDLQHVTTPQLIAEREGAFQKFYDRVAKQFPPLARKLKRRLSGYTVHVKPTKKELALFGHATHGVVQQLGAELSDELRSISTIDQQEAAHQARIIAKRLRYTLEPFAAAEECRQAVTLLKRVQDDLGELHDLHVFANRLDNADALERVNRALQASFTRALDEYFRPAGSMVTTALQGASAFLVKAGSR